MRKDKRSALLLAAAVFFCCSAAFISGAFTPDGSFCHQNGPDRQEHGFLPMISDLQGQAVQFRNVLDYLSQPPVLSVRNHFNEYASDSKPAENLRLSQSCRYIFYAENRIIRLQPGDIVFPFQYFW